MKKIENVHVLYQIWSQNYITLSSANCQNYEKEGNKFILTYPSKGLDSLIFGEGQNQ